MVLILDGNFPWYLFGSTAVSILTFIKKKSFSLGRLRNVFWVTIWYMYHACYSHSDINSDTFFACQSTLSQLFKHFRFLGSEIIGYIHSNILSSQQNCWIPSMFCYDYLLYNSVSLTVTKSLKCQMLE